MASVFALLVGINEYHKDAGVPGLNGCINDIDAMDAFIRSHFSGASLPDIVVLKNEQATRQAVIETFKQQLIHNPGIKEGDTVLFYYSGHGSYATSAPEFIALNEDSKKQDETLVLYDSRLPGNFDLADKELALLLSRVPQQAHMVVILDSCHSGSATRNISRADEIHLGAVRFTSGTDVPRSLAHYVDVDGFSYEKLMAQGTFEIPKSKHLLLAACGRDELAYESPMARGLFSSQLTDFLEDAPALVSYAALYENLYTILKRKAARQAPQLKVYEGFDANLSFLRNETTTGKPTYKVVYNKDAWVINYGALNGLPPDSAHVADCQVQLYDLADASKLLYSATLLQVGLNESIIALPGGINTQLQFAAEIINLPPTLFIYVDGDAPHTALFFQFLEQNDTSSPTLKFHHDPELFQNLILHVGANTLVIRDTRTGELLHGIETITPATVDYIIKALLQIAKWKNLERLENRQTDLPDADITFAFQVKDTAGNWVDCSGNEITFDITPERTEIPFNIRLQTNSVTPYYVALYHLASTFSIEKYSKDVDAALLSREATPALESDNGNVSLVLSDDGINEETEIFKLVYSPEIFYDYFVEERNALVRGIVKPPEARGIRPTKKPSRSAWATKTIAVRLVRQLQQVDDTHGFSNQVLSIKPHPAFKAAVSITPIDTAAKSYNPAKALEQVFTGPAFELISLSETSRGDALIRQSVVELSDIGNENVLQEAPLEINLTYKLQEEEQVMAVSYSDGLVLPIGFLEKSADSHTHVMKLYQAPAQPDTMRTAGKSPVRALWFCFLKVVLKKEDDVFKLRYIEYEKGKAFYADGKVDEKIRQSKKIVLLVHGIIGNTKSLAVNMEPFLQQGTYDCILSFDYENLNTSITKIAAELKKRLEKNGITADKGLDIIAHSMGGLVSRYMIERLGGDALVRRLFLVGTPNNGSNFGKLVAVRNWATGILTLACNYGKSFLGSFGVFLQGLTAVLSATKPITNTLAEMGTGSDFLKELNEAAGPVKTRYSVLAGNTAHYVLPDEAPVKKIMEKIELAVGKLAYWEVANDIAVSVASIETVPAANIENVVEIGCHHLNYFDYDVSMQKLKELIG